MVTSSRPDIYTVGHSNHSAIGFFDLLKIHEIALVADVRSYPYSKHVAHFSQKSLQKLMVSQGVEYTYLGRQLGGRPEGEEFYDMRGKLVTTLVTQSQDFVQAMEWLIETAGARRVALMCGEEDPAVCHRRTLLGRYLIGQGVNLLHIRGTGVLQSEQEVEREAKRAADPDGQLFLFDPAELSGV